MPRRHLLPRCVPHARPLTPCAIRSSFLPPTTASRGSHFMGLTRNALRCGLAFSRKMSFISHVLLDVLRCQFVALLIVSSLNVELRCLLWSLYIQDWKQSSDMSPLEEYESKINYVQMNNQLCSSNLSLRFINLYAWSSDQFRQRRDTAVTITTVPT